MHKILLNTISLETVSPPELAHNSELSLHIEIGKMNSSGTLIKKNPNENEFQLLGEVLHPNGSILRSQKNRKSSEMKKSGKAIDQIVKTILEDLEELSNDIRTNRIDYISGYWSDYSELETLPEIYELSNRIKNSAKNKLENSQLSVQKNSPLITANESKCRMLKKGKNILTKEYPNKDNSNNIFLDLSTFLSGIVTKKDTKGDVTGLFCGSGLNLIDNLIKSHKSSNISEISQITFEDNVKIYEEEVSDFASEISETIKVSEVPSGKKSVGKVPINVNRSYKNHTKIIGCELEFNNSKFNRIREIGKKARSYGLANLAKLSEEIFYRIFGEIIASLETNELIPEETTLYISTRNDVPINWKSNLDQVMGEIGYKSRITEIKFLKNPSNIGFAAEPIN